MSLHKAVRQSDLREVRRLVDAGQDINSRDSHGNTPLMLAAERSYTVTKFLLQNGAVKSYFWRNRDGDMAVDKALDSDRLSEAESDRIVALIQRYESDAIDGELSDGGDENGPALPIPDGKLW